MEDYWSNFIEFDILRTTTTSAVIERLKRYFATHGIPTEVVSDNGPQFHSDEFKKFAEQWMFKHTTSSPYHHRSNGLAESGVKVVKNLLLKSKADGTDIWLALSNQRNTPTAGMQTSPVQRLMSRCTQDLLPLSAELLRPQITIEDDRRNVEKRLEKNKRVKHRGRRELPALRKGDAVWIKPNKLGDREWKKGKVKRKRDEPRSYDVQLNSGAHLRRNCVDLRKAKHSSTLSEAHCAFGFLSETDDETDHEPEKVEPVEFRRSSRTRNKPAYLNDYHLY